MNTRTTTLRRGFCALGAAATLGLGLAGPASADHLPEPIGYSEVKPPPPPTGGSGIEWIQVGGGALAGLALAGAGAALASRRQHAGPHPA